MKTCRRATPPPPSSGRVCWNFSNGWRRKQCVDVSRPLPDGPESRCQVLAARLRARPLPTAKLGKGIWGKGIFGLQPCEAPVFQDWVLMMAVKFLNLQTLNLQTLNLQTLNLQTLNLQTLNLITLNLTT